MITIDEMIAVMSRQYKKPECSEVDKEFCKAAMAQLSFFVRYTRPWFEAEINDRRISGSELWAGGSRQTGETTRQMVSAPRSAVYVWPNNNLDYPIALARFMRRDDLEIISPDGLGADFAGRMLSGVVVDHGCVLDEPQRHALRLLRAVRCCVGAGDA